MSDHRVAIIGSGFSGMRMAIRLLEQGMEDFVVRERVEDVGGTWQANRYPGCQCDIPSRLYSFSFALNPNWSLICSIPPSKSPTWTWCRRACARSRLTRSSPSTVRVTTSTRSFGTGFHVTDIKAARWLRGRDGVLMSDVWGRSPQAYLGVAIAGFPNLFFLGRRRGWRS